MQINYYIDPPGETRIGGWHRDCQFFPGMDEEAQKRAVAEEADPPRELHMHIPLVPTHATEVVPGSHNRWDTPEEFQIRTPRSFAAYVRDFLDLASRDAV